MATAVSTVVAIGPEDVLSFDLCGRPYVLAVCGATYRRALDGRLLLRRPATADAPRMRSLLTPEGGRAVLAKTSQEVTAVLEAVGDQTGVAGRLGTILAMDARALEIDASRFRTLYRRVGVLPPDHYLSVVIEVTEGCSWDACTFCSLYRGVPFHLKTLDQLRVHIDEVKAYFGRSLPLRPRLFLGSANALAVGEERLLPLLDAIAAAFPARPMAAFVDVATGWRHDVPALRRFALRGLGRVHIGVETGDAELLAWLGKPGGSDEARSLVENLHSAGIAVGVIILLGAGGQRFAESHIERTSELLASMALGSQDIVYFSELADPPESYTARAQADAVAPLSLEEFLAQRRAITSRAGLTGGPRVATYDIRDFAYC